MRRWLTTGRAAQRRLGSMPSRVRIVEMGVRDGLQNEGAAFSTKDKLEMIRLLTCAGLPEIEIGSFVSPKWVPKMADTSAIAKAVDRSANVIYSALTPNLKGLDAAIEAKVDRVAVFGTVSESFSQKNINCSVSESLARFEPVLQKARDHNIPVRGYVSCVLGCPYEGDMDPVAVGQLSKDLIAMGCYEVSLGDTIGVGTPRKTEQMLNQVLKQVPVSHVAVHFHDTYGQALANILTALEMGVATVDSSVAGLGGCPYAKGASGNVATEDVVYMLEGMGIDTNVSMPALLKVTAFVQRLLQRPIASKAGLALLNTQSS